MEQQIRQIAEQIYNEKAQAGQFAVSQTTFHTHNGIDSPRINAANLSGTITTNPAGSNGDVQFNNNGVFGADTGNFTYDINTGLLNAPYIEAFNNVTGDVSVITPLLTSPFNLDIKSAGNGGYIQVFAANANSGNTQGGVVELLGGNGNGNGTGGSIELFAGNGSGNANGGGVFLSSGNATSNGSGGNIDLTAGIGLSGNAHGSISLNTIGNNSNAASGDITIIVSNSSGTDMDGGFIHLRPGMPTGSGAFGCVEIDQGNLGIGGVAFNTSSPLIKIYNINTPPSDTPSGSGYLYSSAGTLYWKGSSGTITPIASP